MAEPRQIIERRIVLRHRVAEDYALTRLEQDRLQHVFTDWFPGVVFPDLTDNTVRVDVVVRKGNLSGRSVYNTSFVGPDGSVIKVAYYDEDRFSGKVCNSYDPGRSGYFGQKDGFHYRNLLYTIKPPTPTKKR
jgi:hypothetical protein